MSIPQWVLNREINKRGLFGKALGLEEAIELSLASLQAYAVGRKRWAITYSGGKDSSATLSFVLWAIQTGKVSAPEDLIVLYADTGLELPPLAITAQATLKQVEQLGFTTLTVKAPVENRLYVKMLGYGYPYPTNRRRWCTRLLKKEPMEAALAQYAAEDSLVITGVRKGESKVRDDVISTSCNTSDGECGQGWYQQSRNALAPLVHWRTCNVWRWLYDDRNPLPVLRGIEDVYRAEHLDGLDIRTGCTKCQVVHEDRSFALLVRKSAWKWLAPLHELDQVHEWLAKPGQRLRKVSVDKKADGKTYRKRPNPVGPIHLEARQKALAWLLDIQSSVLQDAPAEFSDWRLITDEEVVAIQDMIARKVYPQTWSGDEPRGSDEYEKSIVIDGELIAIQLLLPLAYEGEPA